MPSPITSDDFNIVNPSGDLCEQLSQLLGVNARLKEWFAWSTNDDGSPTPAFIAWLANVAPPVGSLHHMPVNTVPSGYLLCNGAAVSRTTYSALYAVYGTFFGIGDGITTFNLPDRQGRFLLGAGGAHAVGDVGGSETHALTEAENGPHMHTMSKQVNLDINAAGPGRNLVGESTNPAEFQGTMNTGSSGTGQAHNNMPPFGAGIWICKF